MIQKVLLLIINNIIIGMNGKSYLENLEHYIEGEETEIERGETRDSREAVSNKDWRLNRICGAKGLSCE